jgi:hypothetical protein
MEAVDVGHLVDASGSFVLSGSISLTKNIRRGKL